MDQQPGRIAFIKSGSFSNINLSVERVLRNEFPAHQLDVVDVLPRGRTLPRRQLPGEAVKRLRLAGAAVREYGLDMITGRRSLSEMQLRTRYWFDMVKTKVHRQLRAEDYLFTFQTQSLFDASIPGVPHFLYTDHTHLVNLTYPAFDTARMMPEWWLELERQVYSHARTCFTMSTNVASSLVEDYGCPSSKVACVYAGYNAPPATSYSPDRYANKRILFVGLDWKRKGGPALVEAFALVRKSHPTATLTLVGEVPSLHEPGIEMLGRLPLEQVAAVYARSSVFCMPTSIEPFGIVFIEALSHGLPVVAPRIGAIPDFVLDRRTGLAYEWGDTAALADALNALLAAPEWCRELGDNGRRLVQERYTWDGVGRRLHEQIALRCKCPPSRAAPQGHRAP